MKITKEQYDALSAEQKKLFKAEGDGYTMVGDTEIAAEARRARDREKTRADELATQLQEIKDQLEELQGNDARKNKDIGAIEKSWQDKLTALKTTSDKTTAQLKQQIEKLLIDSSVESIANEIFTKPKRDARLIRERLKVEYDGETPIVRILDKEGKASALTLADLKKETVDNPEFADILVGSKATGSGGTGGENGAGGPKQPKDYTEAERLHLYRTNRAEFDRLFPKSA